MNQYFITKIKDEYLPEIFLEYVREKKIQQYYPIFFIDNQYLRKLKIQNIEQSIDEKDGMLLTFLLNENNVIMITQKEFEEKYKSRGFYSGTSGYAGVSGTYGVSGVSGVSGGWGTTAGTYVTGHSGT